MKRYPPELKERAVRLLLAAREDAGGARGASTRIGQQLGIPADTLRKWLLRSEIDSGVRPGTTTEDAARLLELERENRELRRANAILRSASAFFALMSLWVRWRGWLVSSLLRFGGSFSAICRPASLDERDIVVA